MQHRTLEGKADRPLDASESIGRDDRVLRGVDHEQRIVSRAERVEPSIPQGRRRYHVLVERASLQKRQTGRLVERGQELLRQRHVSAIEARDHKVRAARIRHGNRVERLASLIPGERQDVVHARAHRREAATRQLLEPARVVQEETERRGAIDRIVLPHDDVALVLRECHHGVAVQERHAREPRDINRVARVDGDAPQHPIERSAHQRDALRPGDDEAIGSVIVGKVRERAGARHRERRKRPHGDDGQAGDRTSSRIHVHACRVRPRDREPPTPANRHRVPFLHRPHPVLRIPGEPHGIGLAHIWRWSRARECLRCVCRDDDEQEPTGDPLERPELTERAPGSAVSQPRHERAHENERHPEDEERPRVCVCAENREAEPLPDVAREVQRRVTDTHVHAPRGNEHRHADVTRPSAIAQDEQAGHGHEHHRRPLRPAENAR